MPKELAGTVEGDLYVIDKMVEFIGLSYGLTTGIPRAQNVPPSFGGLPQGGLRLGGLVSVELVFTEWKLPRGIPPILHNQHLFRCQ